MISYNDEKKFKKIMKKKSNEPEGGQVETDKWPLALARPWGLATVLSVRRRRVSFDGNRQIAKNENARGAPSPEIPQTTGWGELARPWASRQLVDEIF